ncbi:hypothetical protein ACGFX8_37650, partial [Streptomyces sp. NPDC048362]
MTTADNVVAGDDDVQAVRRWVRLSCTEPGTHLPALAEIADARRGACWCGGWLLAWCVVGLLRGWVGWFRE